MLERVRGFRRSAQNLKLLLIKRGAKIHSGGRIVEDPLGVRALPELHARLRAPQNADRGGAHGITTFRHWLAHLHVC